MTNLSIERVLRPALRRISLGAVKPASAAPRVDPLISASPARAADASTTSGRRAVCVALLPGKSQLIGIGERVRGIGQASPTFAAAFARQPGLSMFPLCGYRGDELLAHARSDFHARNSLGPASLSRNAGEFEPTKQSQG